MSQEKSKTITSTKDVRTEPAKKQLKLKKGDYLDFKVIPIFFSIVIPLVIIGLVVSNMMSNNNPDITIGTSILRDINITLFSTMATLLGLYVTAFIFLNDSLKNRRNEDETLRDPVNKILKTCRIKIILFAMVTIIAIAFDVIINVFLGQADPTKTAETVAEAENSARAVFDVENTTRSLSHIDWKHFLGGAIVSVVVIFALILESISIMSSDHLIQKHSKRILQTARDNLNKITDDLSLPTPIALPAPIDSVFTLWGRIFSMNEKKRIQIGLYNPDTPTDPKTDQLSFIYEGIKKGAKFKELYSKFDLSVSPEKNTVISKLCVLLCRLYLFRIFHLIQKNQPIVANHIDNNIEPSIEKTLHDLTGKLSPFEKEAKIIYCERIKEKTYSIRKIYLDKNKNPDRLENDLPDGGIAEFSMRFGKAIRLLEELLSRICDNNIDRSILSKEKDFENIESGFTWLYSNNDALGITMSLDVRDEKRFLDYLKYQLIVEEYYSTHPFNNATFEQDFELIKQAFFKLDYSSLDEDKLEDLTQKALIDDYKQKLVFIIKSFFTGYKQLVEYRNALIHIRTPRLKQSRAKLFANKENILNYANTLIQVLIDLFSSFVKINDLNLGNSILDKGWFNYSELSDSSFTHSSFKFARLENAVLKHCDLSTCRFIDADASNTDFSNSNFNYSDLTGTDLSGCTLNEVQMAKVLFRKKAEAYPFDGAKLIIDNALDAIEKGRYPKTIIDKETGKQKDVKPELEYAKIALNSLRTYEGTEKKEIDLESILLKKGFADPNSDLYKKCSVEPFFAVDNNARYAISEYINDAYGEVVKKLQLFFQDRDMSVIDKRFLNALKLACEIEEISDPEKDEEKQKKTIREKRFGKLTLSVATLREATANKVSLPSADFSHVNIASAAFKDSDLSEATMHYTEAKRATFHESNLNQLNAHQAQFDGANFSEANLIGAIFTDCFMDACIFKEANLLDAKIINSSKASSFVSPFCYVIYNDEPILPGASLLHSVVDEHAELPSKHAEGSSKHAPFATSCNFFNAIADNVMILNVDMQKSRFENATMRNCLLFNNIMWWNNFKRAELSNAIIVGVSFYQSNFIRAQLGRTFIYSSDFIGANLAETSFISALLDAIVFDQTKLDGSNFSSATIKNATFRRCAFKDVILTGTRFENVLFDCIDFSNAIGLEQAVFKNCIFIKDNQFVSDDTFEIHLKEKTLPVTLYSQSAFVPSNNNSLNTPTKFSSSTEL